LANQATKSVANLLFNPEETAKNIKAEKDALNKGIQELVSKRDEARLNIQKIDKEANKTSTENSNNLKKTEAQIQAELLTANAVTLQQKIDAAKATFAIESAELIKQGVSKKLIQEKENEIVEKVTKDFNEKKKTDEEKTKADAKAAKDKFIAADMQQIQDAYQKEINFIKIRDKDLVDQTKTNQEIAQKELDSLKAQFNEKAKYKITDLALEQQIADKERQIHDKKIELADKEIAKAKEVRDAQIKAANDYLTALTTFNDAENEQSKNAFDMRMEQLKQQGYSEEEITNMKDAELQKQDDRMRQSFELNKVAQIASALMNTYLGVTSALAILPTQQLYPGQRFVEAGAALAMGLANVYKIQQTQYKSAMPTGGAAGGGSAGSRQNGQGQMQSFAPRMSTLNTNESLTQNRKVFVTEGDITRTQRRVSNNQAISVVE